MSAPVLRSAFDYVVLPPEEMKERRKNKLLFLQFSIFP